MSDEKRLSEVLGLKKIEMDFYGESTQPYNQTCVDVGYNQCLSEIDQFRIDEERLAEILSEKGSIVPKEYKSQRESVFYKSLAKAIKNDTSWLTKEKV